MGAGMRVSDDTPTIAASAVAGVRHLLMEEKLWPSVRAELVRKHADAAGWIDSDLSVDPTKTAWVPVSHHAQMMDALLSAVGAEQTYELGRLRARRTAMAGAFAPVVRSWARSFGSNPTEFLRLTLHAWSSQTQRLGEFVVRETRPGYSCFVLRNASPLLLEGIGWQTFLAGYGTGLLDLIDREGRCEFRIPPGSPDVEVAYTYDEPAAR
jgi:hypothetical protein